MSMCSACRIEEAIHLGVKYRGAPKMDLCDECCQEWEDGEAEAEREEYERRREDLDREFGYS